ncbi:MAG: hypothetical protein PVI91_13365 [Gammaproteobacteria bacterium]|jgi:hypothetical protein
MNDSSGALAAWILVPLFLAVGLYLIWYTRRRRKLMEGFAHAHGLTLRPERTGELQETLDRSFSLEEEGLVRSFGQLSSLVDAGSLRLFRAVELLDLNRHGQARSAHFARIAALFDIPAAHDVFFVMDRYRRATERLRGSESPDPDVTEMAKHAADSCKARHALSITLRRGHGLIYFEPLVTGGETGDDVESLYCIAKRMQAALSASR